MLVMMTSFQNKKDYDDDKNIIVVNVFATCYTYNGHRGGQFHKILKICQTLIGFFGVCLSCNSAEQ